MISIYLNINYNVILIKTHLNNISIFFIMCYIETKYFYAGEGNQLFVYFYGIIFSNKFNIPYIHPGIPTMNIDSTLYLKKKNNLPFKKIVNLKKFLKSNLINKNINYILDYIFEPTIEDYTIFQPYFNYLKNIFPKQKIIYNDDLVYHLRAGDTLLCSGENYKYLNAEKLKKLIDKIKYDKLYIVTNLKKHTLWTMEDLNKYKKNYLKYGDCGSKNSESGLINKEQMHESLNNLNSVIKVLNDKNAIWKSDTIYNDFNFIRSFNKIIINVSTFSWWSAILSDAKEIYASKNWKFLKGDRNKNLPFVELDNWYAVDF